MRQVLLKKLGGTNPVFVTPAFHKAKLDEIYTHVGRKALRDNILIVFFLTTRRGQLQTSKNHDLQDILKTVTGSLNGFVLYI